MKTQIKRYALLASLAGLLAGCTNEIEHVADVEFEVNTPSLTYKVGEPVVFDMDGNPGLITFYSGEVGNDFEYKNKDRIVETRMSFSFTSTTSSGVVEAPNPGRLPVCYSTDFSGVYTEEAVRAATWHDITDLFKMPVTAGVTDMLSGETDFTNFYPGPETPIYFSFHYVVEQFDPAANGGQGNGRTQWQIKVPKVKGTAGETSTDLYDLVNGGWKLVLTPSFDNCSSMPGINTLRILFRSDFQPPVTRECWAVSGPIKRMDFINNGPDWGVGIKALADATLRSYKYTYEKAGEYTATFVATNASAYGRKEAVRQIKLRIVEDEGGITPPEKE